MFDNEDEFFSPVGDDVPPDFPLGLVETLSKRLGVPPEQLRFKRTDDGWVGGVVREDDEMSQRTRRVAEEMERIAETTGDDRAATAMRLMMQIVYERDVTALLRAHDGESPDRLMALIREDMEAEILAGGELADISKYSAFMCMTWGGAIREGLLGDPYYDVDDYHRPDGSHRHGADALERRTRRVRSAVTAAWVVTDKNGNLTTIDGKPFTLNVSTDGGKTFKQADPIWEKYNGVLWQVVKDEEERRATERQMRREMMDRFVIRPDGNYPDEMSDDLGVTMADTLKRYMSDPFMKTHGSKAEQEPLGIRLEDGTTGKITALSPTEAEDGQVNYEVSFPDGGEMVVGIDLAQKADVGMLAVYDAATGKWSAVEADKPFAEPADDTDE